MRSALSRRPPSSVHGAPIELAEPAPADRLAASPATLELPAENRLAARPRRRRPAQPARRDAPPRARGAAARPGVPRHADRSCQPGAVPGPAELSRWRASVVTVARITVMFVDLDDFKTVNDSLGHTGGDELLQVVAGGSRLRCVPSDTAARLGGDEFAVLLEDLARADGALAVAERRPRMALASRSTIGGRDQRGHGQHRRRLSRRRRRRPRMLLRNADVAMYAAKERGKGRVARRSSRPCTTRVDRAAAAQRPISTQRLPTVSSSLVYQPLVDLATRRWSASRRSCAGLTRAAASIAPDRVHPAGGGERPDRPDRPLGARRSACEQLRRWQAADPAAEHFELCINVSACQLADPGFLGRRAYDRRRHRGRPLNGSTLEITASTLSDRRQRADAAPSCTHLKAHRRAARDRRRRSPRVADLPAPDHAQDHLPGDLLELGARLAAVDAPPGRGSAAPRRRRSRRAAQPDRHPQPRSTHVRHLPRFS